MRMHDRPDVGACAIDVAMNAPLARRAPLAEPAAVEIHQSDVLGFERFTGGTGGGYQKIFRISSHTDIAGGAARQTLARQLMAGCDYSLSQLVIGIIHASASRRLTESVIGTTALIELPQSIGTGLTNTTLGDQCGDQPGGGHIESEVESPAALRHHLHGLDRS